MSYNWPSKLTASGLISAAQAKIDAIIDMFDLAVEPANGKILKYNDTTNKFEVATESSVAATQQICAIVNRNAVQSIPSSNTPNQIVFNTELKDTDNAFNTATGTFTVPSGGDGAYHIRGKVVLSGLSSGEQYSLSIRKNGSASGGIQEQQTIHHNGSSNYIATTLVLDAGDTINIWITQETGGALNTAQDTNYSMQIYRVSTFDV